MKKYLPLIVGVFILLFVFDASAQRNELCADKNANFNCLRENFDKLYSTNYDLFWKILHAASNKAQTCSSINDSVNFLMLVSFIKGSAEFEEFFSEKTEKIFMEKPDCYMKALIELDAHYRNKLVERLRTPLFATNNEIRQLFLKYVELDKFKEIVELYFRDK